MAYGFEIAEGTARTVWMAADGSSTYYVGQLVGFNASAGAMSTGAVVPLPVPSGVFDATGEVVIAGIVVGLDQLTPTYGTYGQYISAAITTQADLLARDRYNGGRGMYAPNDRQVMVEVALIDSTTVLKGPICETGGTAPTVVTDSAGSATGYTSAGTTSACSFTPVANTSSIYCRSGANMGLYRVTTDTSTTAPAVTVAFPYDVVAGDTFVRLSLKQGLCHAYISGPGLYLDNTLSGGTTNSYGIHCLYIDAKTAGSEYAVFRFDGVHFSVVRA